MCFFIQSQKETWNNCPDIFTPESTWKYYTIKNLFSWISWTIPLVIFLSVGIMFVSCNFARTLEGGIFCYSAECLLLLGAMCVYNSNCILLWGLIKYVGIIVYYLRIWIYIWFLLHLSSSTFQEYIEFIAICIFIQFTICLLLIRMGLMKRSLK